MATIQERLRESVRQFHEGTVYDGRPELTAEQIAEYEKEPAWIAATHIDALEKRVGKLEASAMTLPKWNDLPDAQRTTIIDAMHFPEPEIRGQVALDAYNAIRRALNGGAKP